MLLSVALSDSIVSLQWLDANPQQPNNVVVLTALSANMSLIALRSLSNVLAVFLHNFWSAPDKATAVLSSNLPSVLLVLDNRAVSNLPYVRAAVSLLASFSVSKVGSYRPRCRWC